MDRENDQHDGFGMGEGSPRTLTDGGSNWLWAVTAIFLVSLLACVALSFRPKNGERIFHYLFTIALFVGTIAYFAMASEHGWSLVEQHLRRNEAAAYQVFYAKYVYWVVAFPTIVMALGLSSGVSWATILYNIFLTWVWIISYLVGAYTPNRYKWGFFTFGTLAYLLLAFQTMFSGLKASKRFTLGRDYTMLAGYANLFWFLYVIGWAVTDGGNVMGVTQMAIYFGVLDILLLPVITFAFIFLSSRWDIGAMNLHFTQYGRVPSGTSTFPEKHHGGHGLGHGTGTGIGHTTGTGVGHTTGTGVGHTTGTGVGHTTGTGVGHTTGPGVGHHDGTGIGHHNGTGIGHHNGTGMGTNPATTAPVGTGGPVGTNAGVGNTVDYTQPSGVGPGANVGGTTTTHHHGSPV